MQYIICCIRFAACHKHDCALDISVIADLLFSNISYSRSDKIFSTNISPKLTVKAFTRFGDR